MRSMFSDYRSKADIGARLEMLRDEIAELSREVSKSGRRAYRGAAHTGEDLVSALPDYARAIVPAARRQARSAEHAVREHPTAAIGIAGLVLLGLAATLIYARR